MLLYNYRSGYYTAHFFFTFVSAALFGTLIAFLIFYWIDCSNVSFCARPSDSDKTDFSFFWGFIHAVVIFAINVAMLIFNSRLRRWVNTTEYLLAQSDPLLSAAPIGESINNKNSTNSSMANSTGKKHRVIRSKNNKKIGKQINSSNVSNPKIYKLYKTITGTKVSCYVLDEYNRSLASSKSVNNTHIV